MNPDSTFTLHHGDSMELLAKINEKFDMIFADPPYFLSNGGISVRNGRIVSVDKGEWDKGGTPEHIHQFNMQWLRLCRERLKEDGTIWVSGTYHNIHDVGACMTELGYKILNIVIWNKTDPAPMVTRKRFQFASEHIIWAARSEKSRHTLNYNLMCQLIGGANMTDVWRIPAVGMWEKQCGKHPTQKPLHLLYRTILASTNPGDTILDPFAGSVTTGIAASLLNRNFVGIDQDKNFIELGYRRYQQIQDPDEEKRKFRMMSENPEELMVLANHARKELAEMMIEKGICYLRAGDTQGSLLVQQGFERMYYLLIHTAGKNARLFRLNTMGKFQIWSRETLEEKGFSPEHAPYYAVLRFNPKNEVPIGQMPNMLRRMNTYCPRLFRASEFIKVR